MASAGIPESPAAAAAAAAPPAAAAAAAAEPTPASRCNQPDEHSAKVQASLNPLDIHKI